MVCVQAVASSHSLTTQVPTGDYKLFSKTGNEVVYDVSLSKVNVELVKNVLYREDTVICLRSDKEFHEFYDENKVLEHLYFVPAKIDLRREKDPKKSLQLDRELEKGMFGFLPTFQAGDTYKFCYQANPYEDFYLEFGSGTITIIQEVNNEAYALLTDVLVEANFTHLNTSSAIPYDNLLVYYPFDRDDNVTSFDFTNNSVDGAYQNGAITGSGRYDKGVVFDGDNDYVYFGNDEILNITGDQTILFWYKTPDLGTTRGAMKKYYASGAKGFILRMSTLGSWSYYNAGCGWKTDSKTNLDDDTWRFVAISVDVDAGINFSNNGVISKSYNDPTCAPNPNGDVNLNLGVEQGGLNWNGSMDELMIFDTVLTSAQISDIYDNVSGRFKTKGSMEALQHTLSESINNRLAVTNPSYELTLASGIDVSACWWKPNESYDTDDATRNGFFNAGETTGVGYVDVGTPENLFFDHEPFALSMWYNTRILPTLGQGLIARGDLNSGAGITKQYMIDELNDDLNFRIGNGTSVLQLFLQDVIGINTWYHILCQVNDTMIMECYLDDVKTGTPITSINVSTINGVAPQNDTFIGAHNVWNKWLNGSIDEVMIFNCSQNRSEISNIYGMGRNYDSYSNPCLVSRWRFNQNTTVAFDDTDGNNGSLEGGGTIIFPNQLVAYYPADGNAVDISNGNNGTFIGGMNATASGVYNNSFVFDGVDDTVLLDQPIQLTEGFTLATWVRMDNADDDAPMFADNSSGGRSSFHFADVGGHKIVGVGYESGNSGTSYEFSGGAENDLMHVATTYNKSDNRIYVNGIEVAAQEGTFLNENFTLNSLGTNRGFATPEKLQGIMDEVIIFDRALSPTEIKSLFVKSRAKWQCGEEQPISNVNVFAIGENSTNARIRYNFTASNNDFYTSILAGNQSVLDFYQNTTEKMYD